MQMPLSLIGRTLMTRQLMLQTVTVITLVACGFILLATGDDLALISFGYATVLSIHWWGT